MSIGTPTSMIAPPTAVCTAPPMRLGFFFPEAGPPSMMVALTEAACAAFFPYDGARNASPPAGRPLRAASLALATGLTSMMGLWSLMVSSLTVGGGSKLRVACDYTGSTEPCAWGGVLATGSSPFGNVLFAGSPKTSAAFRIRADARDAAAKSPISAD